MKTQRKLVLRLLAVFIAIMATITWVGQAEAETTYTTDSATTTTTVVTLPTGTSTTIPGRTFTTNSVGWGGGI